MNHDPRFQVLVLPNISWEQNLARFKQVESLGFDLVATADHFVDWTQPSNPWLEAWTLLAALARETSTIRLTTCVTQIPLRHPAMLARQALTVDHISGGRLEIGIGIGLEIDPSYDMMGIPNWTAKERVARLKEYVEILSALLSNETTSYKGRFYEINEATMIPPTPQRPRPPITIAAMAPVMLKRAATYADTWNSMSFAESFDEQLIETRERIKRVQAHCESVERDPKTLRISYSMFDSSARHQGGRFAYYQSEAAFEDMAAQLFELGISELSLYYPIKEEQVPMFERIATDVLPALRKGHGLRRS